MLNFRSAYYEGISKHLHSGPNADWSIAQTKVTNNPGNCIMLLILYEKLSAADRIC